MVKEVMDEQTFSSGFNKREFVVTTEDKFPQDIKFECLKDKVALLESVAKGQKVKVSFDVRGSEWKGKYFVNLVAWKIDGASGDNNGPDYDDAAAAPTVDPEFEDEPF